MNEEPHIAYTKPTRGAVVGAGIVGSTYAYTVLLQDLADEIVLIDVRGDKARGEAMDLSHAAPFTGRTAIWAGTMDDLTEADLIMISAGMNQKRDRPAWTSSGKTPGSSGTLPRKQEPLAREPSFW